MILEVCCGGRSSVDAAAAGGAPRIELCSHLELDGLTPSWEDLKYARVQYPSLKIHVLIRPRSGDFVYSPAEVSAMCTSIDKALSLGADGIVIGALRPDGSVDEEAIKAMMRPVPVTFHRAFDMCREPFEALEKIISLGCSRILTSGQAASALEGAAMIRTLQEKAGARLTILAGGGVTPENVQEVISLSGCWEVHASASALVDGVKVTQAGTVSAIQQKLLSL